MIALLLDSRPDMVAMDRTAGEAGAVPLRGEMRVNEPMSHHVTWRAGGIADRYYIPADLDDLANALREFSQQTIYVIGLGSNLLVRDGGLRGIVIALHARLNDLQVIEKNDSTGLIYAGAGVACAKVARFSANHGLAGVEFLAGIPGTVGGALAMNAGCFGSETWRFVEQVKVINRNGQIFIRQPEEYEIEYRSVKLRQKAEKASAEWFAGSFFRLSSSDHAQSRQKIKQLLSQRVTSQPLNQPNAGSVFRNPPGDFAARLIEVCGLKGCQLGDAMVSPKHANFIVNIGHATAADIEALIMMVQRRVKKATAIDLIPEVRVIGEPRRLA
ncbi:MAG: UDP-N-acetylmuramate dehydrogenase [Nitrosomonas sp.]|nr:UDP-N-acetylmuramate dehydrogenase [Nitrosomonas sp.]